MNSREVKKQVTISCFAFSFSLTFSDDHHKIIPIPIPIPVPVPSSSCCPCLMILGFRTMVASDHPSCYVCGQISTCITKLGCKDLARPEIKFLLFGPLYFS